MAHLLDLVDLVHEHREERHADDLNVIYDVLCDKALPSACVIRAFPPSV